MSDPIVEPVVHDLTAVLHHSVAAGMPLLLLLDFDGTLVELAPEPDAIVVPAGATGILREIVRAGHRVVILTGRPRSFVVERLALADDDSIGVIGLHGLEWPGEPLPSRDVDLDVALAAITTALKSVPADGVLIEDKGSSLAVHTRQVAVAAKDTIVATLKTTLLPFAGGALALLQGHEVWELRPRMADKGQAALRLKAMAPGHQVVMCGDDRTDEEAFLALAAADGAESTPAGRQAVTIRVGSSAVETNARHRLAGPPGVWALLAALLPRGCVPAEKEDE